MKRIIAAALAAAAIGGLSGCAATKTDQAAAAPAPTRAPIVDDRPGILAGLDLCHAVADGALTDIDPQLAKVQAGLEDWDVAAFKAGRKAFNDASASVDAVVAKYTAASRDLRQSASTFSEALTMAAEQMSPDSVSALGPMVDLIGDAGTNFSDACADSAGVA